eukprot:SAG31_NODE_240_length_19407_cov_29.686140_1_plen_72_part_00
MSHADGDLQCARHKYISTAVASAHTILNLVQLAASSAIRNNTIWYRSGETLVLAAAQVRSHAVLRTHGEFP